MANVLDLGLADKSHNPQFSPFFLSTICPPMPSRKPSEVIEAAAPALGRMEALVDPGEMIRRAPGLAGNLALAGRAMTKHHPSEGCVAQGAA